MSDVYGTLLKRLKGSILRNSRSGQFLIAALLSIGILIFLVSGTLQVSWLLGTEITFPLYKIVWSLTQFVLLGIVIFFRWFFRRDDGITLLEIAGFRILFATILSALLLSAVIGLTEWVEPIATNTLLSIFHLTIFLSLPVHFTRAFQFASLPFFIAALVMMFSPSLSDIVYGTAWLIAAFIASYTIKTETGGLR